MTAPTAPLPTAPLPTAPFPTVDRLAGRGVSSGPRLLNRLPAGLDPRPYPFGVRPMSPTIGAEVLVELADLVATDPVDEAVDERWAAVHRALLEFKVLVFRDQDLDGPTQRAVATRWIDPDHRPSEPDVESDVESDVGPDVEMPAGGSLWHSDETWRVRPPKAALVRAVDVPTSGGDTLWADMAAAYEGLPSAVRERIDDRWAVHDVALRPGAPGTPTSSPEFQDGHPAVEHPMVRVHPETDRRTLFVNPAFTSHPVGLDRDDGEQLLRQLFHQAEIPEYQCRMTWRPGTVVLWDCRATQHYEVNDYHPQRRVMERVTIGGDRPV